MPDAGKRKDSKPMKWHHLHFGTVLVLTAVATLLVSANVWSDFGGTHSDVGICRGWPAYAAGHWWEGQGRFVPEDAELIVSPFGIALDLVVGLSILALVAFVCEWKARSPRAKWLYLHRPTGSLVLLLAE